MQAMPLAGDLADAHSADCIFRLRKNAAEVQFRENEHLARENCVCGMHTYEQTNYHLPVCVNAARSGKRFSLCLQVRMRDQ